MPTVGMPASWFCSRCDDDWLIRFLTGGYKRAGAGATPSPGSPFLMEPSAGLAATLGGADLKLDRRAKELHEAAERGDEDQVRALLDSGAPVNGYFEISGYTAYPLEGALQHPKIAGILLDAGAVPQGRTPSHPLGTFCQALRSGDPGVVRLLFETGAKVPPGEWVGRTALHCAAWSSTDRSEEIALLLRAGADVNVRDEAGRTPLYYAAIGACPENVKALLDSGADVNAAVDANAVSQGVAVPLPINQACMGNEFGFGASTDVVRQLVAAGSKLDEPGYDGMTPLHWAAVRGHDAMAEVLLEAGANANARATMEASYCKVGWTPADCAEHGVAVNIDPKYSGAGVRWIRTRGKYPELAKKIRARGEASPLRFLPRRELIPEGRDLGRSEQARPSSSSRGGHPNLAYVEQHPGYCYPEVANQAGETQGGAGSGVTGTRWPPFP